MNRVSWFEFSFEYATTLKLLGRVSCPFGFHETQGISRGFMPKKIKNNMWFE